MPVETINGTPLAYDVEGQGPPLVLLHGSWSERLTWAPVVPVLARSFRVISYDRRGHGESASDPEAGTVDDDVADAAALIETLGAAPAHLVANSSGGCIALRLAAERPDLVSRLACHEPSLLEVLNATAEDRAVADAERRMFEEVCRRIEQDGPAAGAEHFVETGLGAGVWAALPEPARERIVRNAPTFLGEARDPGYLRADLDALRRLAAAVLLTQGDQSSESLLRINDRLVRLLPNVHQETIAGAGHLPHLTHSKEYAGVVARFLLENSNRAPAQQAEG